MAVDDVTADVLVTFGGSRSSDFRDIRFRTNVSNERTNEHDEVYPKCAKRLGGISPKMIQESEHETGGFQHSENTDPATTEKDNVNHLQHCQCC